MTSQAVIVTGASSGLGAAIAQQLGRLGANVVITARRAEELNETAAQVVAAGGQATVVPGDITDPQTAPLLVQTAMDTYGRLDAVINNAGTLDPIATIADTTVDAWRETFEINFFSAYMLVQHALPHLRDAEDYGRVVSISSGASTKGYPTWGAYGVTKAALNHFTHTLSAEEPHIIPIALRPGVVNTAMQQKIREEGKDVMPDVLFERFQNMYDAGKLLDASQPGFATAVLALHAPPDWSGQYMNWDDELLRRLCERVEPGLTPMPPSEGA